MSLDPMSLINVGGWAAFAIYNATVIKKAVDSNTLSLQQLKEAIEGLKRK